MGKDKLQVRGRFLVKFPLVGVPVVPHINGTLIIGLLDVGNLVVQQSSGEHCMKSVFGRLSCSGGEGTWGVFFRILWLIGLIFELRIGLVFQYTQLQLMS